MEVVDYSLLVGIHFTAPPSDKVEVRPAVCRLVPAEQPQPGGGRLAIERTTTLAQLFGHVDTLAGALPSKLSRHGAGTQEVRARAACDASRAVLSPRTSRTPATPSSPGPAPRRVPRARRSTSWGL